MPGIIPGSSVLLFMEFHSVFSRINEKTALEIFLLAGRNRIQRLGVLMVGILAWKVLSGYPLNCLDSYSFGCILSGCALKYSDIASRIKSSIGSRS